jgi:hypothetical protein
MRERNGVRELAIVVASVATLVHFLDRLEGFLVAALIAAAAAAGTANLIGDWRPWREPLSPLALPFLAAFSIAGIARIPTTLPPLAVVAIGGALLLLWVFSLERVGFFARPAAGEEVTARSSASAVPPQPVIRIRTRRRPESELPQLVVEELEEPEKPVLPHPRQLAVRSTALAMAFVGFVAVVGFVPGMLSGTEQSLSIADLFVGSLLSGGVAALAGYRIAALIAPNRYDRVVRVLACLQYGAPIALATWILRGLALPRLFIPALLTLGVYVISGLRESSEPIAINRRLLQELAILGVVAAIALAWGLMAR